MPRRLPPVLCRLPWRAGRREWRESSRGSTSKPRDFQLGVFKCRSTPTGTLPADQDLFDTIARGFDRSKCRHGTPSPSKSAPTSWPGLSTSLRAGQTKNLEPQSRFLPSRKSPRSASRRAAMCLQECSAGSATASRVWPMGPRLRPSPMIRAALSQPFNFTEGSRPKCGDTDRDIYRIFMTGLDGTPMPSFADNIKPDEAWDLVFYLRTFMSQNSKEKEMAKQLGLKPVDPNAPVAPASQP